MATRAALSATRTLRPRLALARVSGCTLRPLSTSHSPRNRLAAAAATSETDPRIIFPSVTKTQPADNDVRDLFDTTYTPRTAEPTGLFTLGPLASPDSLPPLTERTLVHAQAIVDRISRAPEDTTGRELRLVVKNLDRLSDLLCGVIDMCELVRNAHPDGRWIAAADRAYERLCSYMNGLNTDRGLFLSLVATLEAQHSPPLSHAERQVALTFLRDFEKSGIDLPPGARARFVELSDSLLSLGRTFLSNASSGPPTDRPIEFPNADKLLDGLPSHFIASLPQRRGTALVEPGSYESQVIQRYAREGEARRLAYVGNNAADPERVEVLENMLAQRAELAGVLGKQNWAEVALVDKMAKNPENVRGFLTSLAEHHRDSASNDIGVLQRLKGSALTGIMDKDILRRINAWDRDYFTEKHVQSLAPASLPPLSPYFSTGTVMRGLSRLFSRLYGISFRPAPVSPGEVWHPSVRRLDVVDETEGTIGVIYCDLFSREGKPPNAAHYTVRCSRRVDDDDVAGDGLSDGWDSSWGPGLETPGSAVRGKDGKYQLPIVVLTTDFGEVERGRPALLGWHEVETLFHEMGHAMHSMIGRTEYHNVSGTRCATDFVELPSILMEHFVKAPEVLSLFAEHYQTGQQLPIPLLDAHMSLQQSFAALETHAQIVMAVLDHRYHCLSPGEAVDSSATYAALQESVGVIPPVEGTAWQTQFGHLFGYGATYYSYLFDRAIAGKVFSTLFKDPLSRDGGDLFKNKLLKWGGGRDPWEMVGDVVGGEEGEAVAKGDERAMEIVGGWHIK